MSTNQNKNNLTAWAIVVIIGLLGLNAYQWYANNQLKTINEERQTELFELEKIQGELNQDYQAALESLEELRGDNKELNLLIDSQKQELTAQKDKINNLIWSKRELNKAKEEIANLNTLATQYVAEVTKLKEENESLMASNSQLQAVNQDLSAKYQAEMIAREEISQARAVLASEKEKLAKSNNELSVKVDMANAIKINWLQVQGYQVKDDGKLKKKSKAKDIQRLTTCFKTETNMVTPAGSKKFYVRIIDPTGETLAVESKGSGILTNKLNNTQVRYTTAGLLEYNNEDTEGCIDWNLDFRLPKGMYEIELYNNGFLVGKGDFKLK